MLALGTAASQSCVKCNVFERKARPVTDRERERGVHGRESPRCRGWMPRGATILLRSLPGMTLLFSVLAVCCLCARVRRTCKVISSRWEHLAACDQVSLSHWAWLWYTKESESTGVPSQPSRRSFKSPSTACFERRIKTLPPLFLFSEPTARARSSWFC